MNLLAWRDLSLSQHSCLQTPDRFRMVTLTLPCHNPLPKESAICKRSTQQTMSGTFRRLKHETFWRSSSPSSGIPFLSTWKRKGVCMNIYTMDRTRTGRET